MASNNTRPYYDRDIVDLVFTPGRITEQGQYLLKRALNIGKVVVFVGSGVPAAYGRPMWSELIDRAEAVLKESQGSASAQRPPGGETSLHTILTPNDRLRDEYIETLDALSEASSGDEFSDADLLPLKAHILQLSDSVSTAEHEFRQGIKRGTRSDRLGLREKMARVVNLAVLDYQPDLAMKTKVQDPDCSFVDLAWLNRHEFRKDFATGLNATPHLNAAIKGDGDELLNAEEVSTASLIAAALVARDGLLSSMEDLRPKSEHKIDQASRPLLHDPIQLLYETAKLRRVITTNYDFELERSLEALGFPIGSLRQRTDNDRRPADGRYTAQNTRGQRARASVFDKDTAVDLIDFASGQSGLSYDIFHLHGRAAEDDPLVATERDYQRLYLRYSPERHVMSEALRVLFGGNPILFVGLGMQEGDILRPLRQFMSDPAAQINRTVFALMPAEQRKQRRTRNALQFYLRYGVHSLYFGDRWTSQGDGQAKREPDHFQKSPWANSRRTSTASSDNSAVREGLSALKTMLGAASDGEDRYAKFGELLLALIEKASDTSTEARPKVAAAGDGAVTASSMNGEDEAPLYIALERLKALKAVLDAKPPTEGAGPKLDQLFTWIGEAPETSTRAWLMHFLGAGLMEIATTAGWLVSAGDEVTPGKGSVIGAALCDLPAVISLVSKQSGPSRDRALALLGVFLRELDSRLRTTALCQAIVELEEDRKDWWKNWRRIPKSRRLNIFPRILRESEVGQDIPNPDPAGGSPVAESTRFTWSPPGDWDDAGGTLSAVRYSLEGKLPTLPFSAMVRERLWRDGKNGRKVLLLLGSRGAGKGRYFHDLEANLMMPTKSGRKQWTYGVFANAAFSTEYHSVIGGVTEFLEKIANADTHPIDCPVQQSREGRLRNALDSALKRCGPTKRILLVFSGVEVLFQRNGTPKNRDIANALAVLLDGSYLNSAFDVVFICRNDRASPIFLTPEAVAGMRRGLRMTPAQDGEGTPATAPRSGPGGAVTLSLSPESPRDLERLPPPLTETTKRIQGLGRVMCAYRTDRE